VKGRRDSVWGGRAGEGVEGVGAVGAERQGGGGIARSVWRGLGGGGAGQGRGSGTWEGTLLAVEQMK